MLVIASGGDDLHAGCLPSAAGRAIPPQPSYVVGKLVAPTALARDGTFGWVDFDDPLSGEFTTELPEDPVPLARSPLPGPLMRAGILDDVLFFIDDSDPDHPALAQGIRRGARFDVVPIADDVEDLQVAYGVDGLYGLDGRAPDGSLGRFEPTSSSDPDPDASIRKDADEWAPSAPGERPFEAQEFQRIQPPPAGFPHDGSSQSSHCPVLKAVMIALVVRSHDPDPSYRGPESHGVRTMNRDASPSPPARYRRRSQIMKVSLRNFGLDG